ncbi:hypothetical protein B0T17DRAFT_617322 [Bombardia bombarda]|uniref:Uncharacterized protein n=1 Tax=Bombardia bombarda TaxID=252184 RepID=A0AA40C597_9PEZI|nr:hypothetical protein B0T17DRAFT_617322 [Bombardia bombarda]
MPRPEHRSGATSGDFRTQHQHLADTRWSDDHPATRSDDGAVVGLRRTYSKFRSWTGSTSSEARMSLHSSAESLPSRAGSVRRTDTADRSEQGRDGQWSRQSRAESESDASVPLLSLDTGDQFTLTESLIAESPMLRSCWGNDTGRGDKWTRDNRPESTNDSTPLVQTPTCSLTGLDRWIDASRPEEAGDDKKDGDARQKSTTTSRLPDSPDRTPTKLTTPPAPEIHLRVASAPSSESREMHRNDAPAGFDPSTPTRPQRPSPAQRPPVPDAPKPAGRGRSTPSLLGVGSSSLESSFSERTPERLSGHYAKPLPLTPGPREGKRSSASSPTRRYTPTLTTIADNEQTGEPGQQLSPSSQRVSGIAAGACRSSAVPSVGGNFSSELWALTNAVEEALKDSMDVDTSVGVPEQDHDMASAFPHPLTTSKSPPRTPSTNVDKPSESADVQSGSRADVSDLSSASGTVQDQALRHVPSQIRLEESLMPPTSPHHSIPPRAGTPPSQAGNALVSSLQRSPASEQTAFDMDRSISWATKKGSWSSSTVDRGSGMSGDTMLNTIRSSIASRKSVSFMEDANDGKASQRSSKEAESAAVGRPKALLHSPSSPHLYSAPDSSTAEPIPIPSSSQPSHPRRPSSRPGPLELNANWGAARSWQPSSTSHPPRGRQRANSSAAVPKHPLTPNLDPSPTPPTAPLSPPITATRPVTPPPSGGDNAGMTSRWSPDSSPERPSGPTGFQKVVKALGFPKLKKTKPPSIYEVKEDTLATGGSTTGMGGTLGASGALMGAMDSVASAGTGTGRGRRGGGAGTLPRSASPGQAVAAAVALLPSLSVTRRQPRRKISIPLLWKKAAEEDEDEERRQRGEETKGIGDGGG